VVDAPEEDKPTYYWWQYCYFDMLVAESTLSCFSLYCESKEAFLDDDRVNLCGRLCEYHLCFNLFPLFSLLTNLNVGGCSS
jgi:hypothetical protein